MIIEKRYPFLSDNNLELIRHISLPFSFGGSYSPPPDVVTFTQTLMAFPIIPSRHYQLKNFEIGLDYALSTSGTSIPNTNVSLLNIQGLQLNNLTIDTILSDYGNPAYTYNGVVNNPDKGLQMPDIYSQDGATALSGTFNVLSLTNVAAPPNYSNLLGQKSIGNQISSVPIAGGFTNYVVPTASHKEMYIRNSNYSAILMSLTPIHRGAGANLNISGVVSLDLYQYSMKN